MHLSALRNQFPEGGPFRKFPNAALRVTVAAGLSTLFSAVATRWLYHWALFTHGDVDLRALLRYAQRSVYVQQVGFDLGLVWGVALLAFAFALLDVAMVQRAAQSDRASWRMHAFVVVVLALIGAAAAVHLRLIIEMRTGLDTVALLEAQSVQWVELWGYVHRFDVLILCVPMLMYGVLWLFVCSWVQWRIIFVVCACMLLLVAAQHPPRNDRARAVLRHHPIVSLGQELWRQLRAGAEHAHPVSKEQLSQISLVDPRFVGEPQAASWPTRPGPAPKNVVFVVLESVGNEYLFGGEHLAEDRMPTLARIAQEGVRLSAHRSTANTSPRSIFSLFSGLYDVPTAAIWSIGGEVEVPALFSFLSPKYERFLVTPGRLHSFFPRSFFVNNGMNEMEDKTTIVAKRPSPSGAAVDERDGMDRFLARLAQSKRPFFGVYYSYAAHYPYHEYGAEAEADDVGAKKDDFVRYLSNLKQLDAELRRLLDALATAGHLDDTLLVIVGDHGEAFLQHKGNKGHSRRSFEENLRVPAILWAPQVLLPHVETRTTSHIDITPTVLDVLGLPYERDLFHGESLLGPLKRRVLFTMGNEGVVTSLWGDGTKLALDIHREDCVTYDLTLDPGERHRARCGVGSEREATETWAQLTRRQLTAYNQTTRARTPYFGLCHATRCANAVRLATE